MFCDLHIYVTGSDDNGTDTLEGTVAPIQHVNQRRFTDPTVLFQMFVIKMQEKNKKKNKRNENPKVLTINDKNDDNNFK